MKCRDCGSEHFEFSRFEEIGMHASELLMEKIDRQNAYVKELEKKCAELQEQWSLERWRKHKLISLVYQLDELKEEMFEAEFLSLEQMNKEKAAEGST